MKKLATSLFLVLALSFSFSLPAIAVDDSNYYSLPPVGGSEPSTASLYPLNPAEFDNSDSQTLTNIYKIIQYLYLSPASWQPDSIIGFLSRILDRIPSNLSTNFALQGGDGTNAILDSIRGWVMQTYNYLSSDNIAGNLGNIQRNTAASADRLLSLVSALGDGGIATEKSLSSFLSAFRDIFATGMSATLSPDYGTRFPFKNPDNSTVYVSFGQLLWYFQSYLAYDGLLDGQYTLYHFVKNLSETLASEDDKQLAENYKENREQAEQDFLSGKSGKTSLGKGDFSNASQVGGALNDTFNMGGASKVSDFVSGFGSAGEESLSWFSDTTANNLDGVTAAGNSTSGVSTFSDDGKTMVGVDPDPYNMAEISERYEWLEGVLG